MTATATKGKPGEFRARCHLHRYRPESTLTPEERRVAKENGYPRRHRGDLSKPRWEVGFPECAGFETTDRDDYLRHVAEHHGRKPRGPAQIKLGRGNWRPPKLTADGMPFKSRDSLTEACPACGLINEISPSRAAGLWWREHLERCTGEQTAVA